MPVLLDLSKGAAALQIAREIRTQRASTLMFAVVDARRPDLTTEAVLAGMADVFARPLGGRRVANAIERELKYEARENIPASFENGDDLYGHSMAMRDVMALIGRAAGMRAGVLIRGEDGTGRQVAARAIHTLQQPAAGAFVSVDCAARDGEELEAELFGPPLRGQHGDGSKGLERVSRQSRLHTARGRHALPAEHRRGADAGAGAARARAARSRGDHARRPAEATVSFDVRPMAGVDQAFDTAVLDGRVREDLFRRLSIIRIEMPPLRTRREDIPALANYFVREICAALAPAAQDAVALGAVAALGAPLARQCRRAPASAGLGRHRHAGRPRHRARGCPGARAARRRR